MDLSSGHFYFCFIVYCLVNNIQARRNSPELIVTPKVALLSLANGPNFKIILY